MRPLRYSIKVTLDGAGIIAPFPPTRSCIVTRSRISRGADALLFGRVTYQTMEAAFRQPPGASNVAEGVVNGAPYVGTGVRVDIGVGSWNEDDRAGRFNYQAVLLHHELRHLYPNQFAGTRGSQIVDHGGSTAASDANFFKVLDSCGPVARCPSGTSD